MKTNWQDPGTSEIFSSNISGLQEAIGKIEDSIGLKTTAETGITLSEVYVTSTDRYRIFQVAEGKRNWVASPAPVVYKNDVEIATGFSIDYGGGAIVLETPALNTDAFTADFTRTNSTSDVNTHLAETAVDAHLAKNIGIEDTAENFTAGNVEGALSELFTNVSDGKDSVGTAITDVDPSVTVPTDPTFAELATAIGQISTGKKSASGTITSSGDSKNYTDGSGASVSKFYITVPDLAFTAKTILVYDPLVPLPNGAYSEILAAQNAGYFIYSLTNVSTGIRKIGNFYINSSEFSVPVSNAVRSYKWIAIE